MTYVEEESFDWRIYAAVGVGYAAALFLFDAVGLDGPAYSFGLAALLFGVLGGLCLWNYSSCSTTHCAITGPSYLVIALLAVLMAASILAANGNLIWGLWLAATAVGFGVEHLLDRRGPTDPDEAGAA